MTKTAPERICDTCGLPDPARNPYCFCKQEKAMTDAEYQELHSEWTATMTDNANALPIQDAVAELRGLTTCRCDAAYKDRGLHDPACECDSADAVEAVASRIDALEKALRGLVDAGRRYRDFALDHAQHDEVMPKTITVESKRLELAVADARAALGEGE